MFSFKFAPEDINSYFELYLFLKNHHAELASSKDLPLDEVHYVTSRKSSDGTPLGCIMLHIPKITQKDETAPHGLGLVDDTPHTCQMLVGIAAPVSFERGPIKAETLIFMKSLPQAL